MEQRQNRAQSAKQRARAQKTRLGMIVAAILAAVILLLDLATILTPDRSYSDQENRMLAQAPVLSGAKLADGSFFSDTESHFSDQFAGRDTWMGLNLARARLFGAKENGGVYLGRGGYLMQVPSEPDEEALARNLQAINAFAKRHSELKIYMSTVPNAFCVLSKRLPAGAPVRDQEADIRNIASSLRGVQFLDVTAALKEHSKEALYYRTDHHWTSLGAKYAFEAMAPGLGIAPETEYEIYTVTTEFQGTLASRSGDHSAKDTIELYVPKWNVEYSVNYRDNQRTVCSLYSRAALEEKDQYTVFFGGNHPRIDIKTTSESSRVLLVLKDSYANCFIQFLTPYFKEIVMVDPRYYYDNLETLLKQENVTDVLLLYNTDTFLTDTALADVIGE